MKIGIITTDPGDSLGGAEVLAERLKLELISRNNNVEIIYIGHQLGNIRGLLQTLNEVRNLDLNRFDLVISTKFPCYYIEHPNHRVWLLHQFRPLLDLFGTPHGWVLNWENVNLQKKLFELDRFTLQRVNVRVNSSTTQYRLSNTTGIHAKILEAPLSQETTDLKMPPELEYFKFDNYVISPGRLSRVKRQDLVVSSFLEVESSVGLIVFGKPEDEAYLKQLHKIAKNDRRVLIIDRWMTKEEMNWLYQRASITVYIPVGEDSYGYVLGEGLSHGNCLITTSDSGGCATFTDLMHEKICEPNSKSLSEALNELLKQDDLFSDSSKSKRKLKWNNYSTNWDEVTSWILGQE